MTGQVAVPRGDAHTPRITPGKCADADLLVAAGWQWCASNRRWFRTRGPEPFRGACGVCKESNAPSNMASDLLEYDHIEGPAATPSPAGPSRPATLEGVVDR